MAFWAIHPQKYIPNKFLLQTISSLKVCSISKTKEMFLKGFKTYPRNQLKGSNYEKLFVG